MKISKEGNYYIFEDGISKSNKLSYVSLIKKNNREDIIKLKIISKMLKSTSKSLNRYELAAMSAAKYDLEFNKSTTDMYNYIILEHSILYISEKYADGLEFSDVEALLFDYIANRNIEKSDFNQALKSLKVELDILKNDYTKLARRLTRDLVYQNNQMYLTLKQYEEYLTNVSFEDIVNYSNEIQRVKDYVLHKTNVHEMARFKLLKNEAKIERYLVDESEQLDVVYDYQIDQAKVNIIYNIEKDFPRELMIIFNLIFGGDSFSKLFTNVREKHSICYTINSQVVNRDFIQVQTGVNHENINLVCQLIDEQLLEIINGNIVELNNAKDKLISIYRAIENDYESRKNLVERNVLYDEEIEIEQIIKKVEAITGEDVINVAKSLRKIKQLVLK